MKRIFLLLAFLVFFCGVGFSQPSYSSGGGLGGNTTTTGTELFGWMTWSGLVSDINPELWLTSSWGYGCIIETSIDHTEWTLTDQPGGSSATTSVGSYLENDYCKVKVNAIYVTSTSVEVDIYYTYKAAILNPTSPATISVKTRTGYTWGSRYITNFYNLNNDTVSLGNTAPTTVGFSGVPAHQNYGVTFSLTATWIDNEGYGDLEHTRFLIRDGVNGSNACYLLLYPSSNTVYLMNPAADSWGSPITLGTSGWLDNGWCHINGSGSSFGTSGTTDRTATISLYFRPPMLAYGTLNYYLYAADNAGTNSGWQGSYATTALHSGPKLIISKHD
jgi:hypothetical protein